MIPRMTHSAAPDSADPPESPTGIIIVDHGSRRGESNDMLLEVVALYRKRSRFAIVEPAHMELAEPSIATAFARCVAQGARRVVVMPYFLGPGKHWDQDIPRLSAAAAAAHRGVSYLVTAPIGLHPLMAQLIEARIGECIACASGQAAECDVCAGTGRCRKWQE